MGRVAFSGTGPLDCMAAAWLLLGKGRVLVEATEADFGIDDALCRQSEIRTEPYSLRCTVQASMRWLRSWSSMASARLGFSRFAHTTSLVMDNP